MAKFKKKPLATTVEIDDKLPSQDLSTSVFINTCNCIVGTVVLTMMRKSAWVPVNTGMSIGTRTE